MPSSIITDFIGRGTHAGRPDPPDIAAGATAIYYETDTDSAYIWDGAVWRAISGSAATRLDRIFVGIGGAATIDFTGISADFKALQIRLQGSSDTTGFEFDFLHMQFNGDTTSGNYGTTVRRIRTGSATTQDLSSDVAIDLDVYTTRLATDAMTLTVIDIPAYTYAAGKHVSFRSAAFTGGGTSSDQQLIVLGDGLYTGAGAIFSAQLYLDHGNFVNGTIATLYGY